MKEKWREQRYNEERGRGRMRKKGGKKGRGRRKSITKGAVMDRNGVYIYRVYITAKKRVILTLLRLSQLQLN